MTALFGDVTGLFAQLLLGDELLDLVDGNRTVKLTAGACVLASSVADAAADRRERVILLDELESIKISALACHFDITLNGDMCRASCLAGSGAALVAVFLVVVLVVHVPHMLAPVVVIGQRLLGIYNRAVFGAELLAKLCRACRTYLNTLAAGTALFLIDMCAIRGSGHIGGIEKLGGAQGKAGAERTVADGEDLVLAVNVGYLMHIAVFLGALEDAQRLFVGDIAALACLDAVSCKGADRYTQLLLKLAAALAHKAHCVAAGAVAYTELSLILLEPVGDMLNAHRLVGRRDGLFDRDNVHAYAVASGRYHRSDLGQGQKRHTLEELCYFGVLLNLINMHVHKLGCAGNEDGQNILTAAVGSIVVVLQNALGGQIVHDLLNVGNGLAHFLCDLLGSRGLAEIHCQCNVGLLVTDDAVKAVVLRVVLRQLLKSELVGYAVGHFLAERNDFFSCHM